ncbi:hypothetical protein [Romboutsia hominis]|uniref:Ribosomal protein S1-like RNA-binding domain n=1 Tax=Romboutsia hominis TaxID=1507512 RepID=A0A2P2BQF6_9FIRM|nr:hypothetical protein [Romboutsia hominis]CEI72579.1 Ribosomal protein S1-like RNA-binding domain [Romboutsia hominis]
MRFNKSKAITKEDNKNQKIYINKIDTDETIILDNEYIFLDSIKTTQDIVVMKKTIVLGDMECNFLNALEEIICYGNIKVNTIYTNKDIEYFKDISYNTVVSGNVRKKQIGEETIREVEVIKEVQVIKTVDVEVEKIVEVNPLQDTKIDNETLADKLIIIDEFKDKIVNYRDSELIFLENDILLEDLEQIGLTFEEYKRDSEILKSIIHYSNINEIYTLNEYLEFLNIIKDIPQWLEELDIVDEVINNHKIYFSEELLELEIVLDNVDDFIKLIGSINSCKKELGNNYEEIGQLVIKKYYETINGQIEQNQVQKELIDTKKENIVDIIREVAYQEIKEKVDINELYEKYIWKKGKLIECNIINIKNDTLELEEINNSDKDNLSILMKKQKQSIYQVGDKLFVHINNVQINNEKIEIEVSNDSDNMPRLLFNKLREKYDLSKCSIQKYERIKGIATCIVIVLLEKDTDTKMIKHIQEDMKKYLGKEDIRIFIYDKNPEIFLCNMLDIKESNICTYKSLKKCVVTINPDEENRISNLLDKQGNNIKNIFEYEIDIKVNSVNKNINLNKDTKEENNLIKKLDNKRERESDNETKNVEIANDKEIYAKLLSQKGNLLGGKIIKMSNEEIQIDIGYKAEIVIKYFDKSVLTKYKVGDYIEGVIENITKKEDQSVRSILSRDDVDFVKGCLKDVRNEMNLKSITFKAVKKIKNKNEYAVLITTLENILESKIRELKEKVEAKLDVGTVEIYIYNSDITKLIKNITKANIKSTKKYDILSMCKIVCSKEDMQNVKEKEETIKLLTSCKKIDIKVSQDDGSKSKVVANDLIKEIEEKGNDTSKSELAITKVSPGMRKDLINLEQKYDSKKWSIVEGKVKAIYKDEIEFEIEENVVGVLKRYTATEKNKLYKHNEVAPCYVCGVVNTGDKVKLQLIKSSDNYFKQLFNYYKNQLDIKLCNVKKCTYDKEHGVLIIIEDRYKKVTKEELKFIEELMNNECGRDIVKIVRFQFNAEAFLSEVFDVFIDQVKQEGPGRFKIVKLDSRKKERAQFVYNQIYRMINYKVEL